MAMKKIKRQFGKVILPSNNLMENQTEDEIQNQLPPSPLVPEISAAKFQIAIENQAPKKKSEKDSLSKSDKHVHRSTDDPNPFLQTKEIFGKARLTKIGYRMRTDYVEILDIIKKMKKNGYTLEAVLDDALTFYFEKSDDGQEALRKAHLFYS